MLNPYHDHNASLKYHHDHISHYHNVSLKFDHQRWSWTLPLCLLLCNIHQDKQNIEVWKCFNIFIFLIVQYFIFFSTFQYFQYSPRQLPILCGGWIALFPTGFSAAPQKGKRTPNGFHRDLSLPFVQVSPFPFPRRWKKNTNSWKTDLVVISLYIS